ncbi:MAG: PQQ-binding-like beta-propeller repeat protein [Candidatus Binatia bacterium]
MRSRLVLAFAVLLAACSDGGSSGTPTVPALPWGSFRQSPTNSAAAGAINRNTGVPRLLSGSGTLGEVTISTPALDNGGNFYVGTTDGLISVDDKGEMRWLFDRCDLSGTAACTPETCVDVGPVSASPTVSAGGTIVVGSDDGRIFALHQRNDDIECMWMVPPGGTSPTFGVQSSPVLQIDPRDLSLLSVFIGGGNGQLLALNGIGTQRWAFPSAGQAGSAVSSSPAADAFSNLYITTPDGFLTSIEFGGGLNWTYPIGVPPAQPLLPSAAVGLSAYAVGAGGALYALTQNGILKWVYTPAAETSGSPAFLNQTFEAGADQVVDTIVYIADVNGTLYGVRDLTGMIAQPQRCSEDLETSCRKDSCEPNHGTCDRSTSRCTEGTDIGCNGDSCSDSEDDPNKCISLSGIRSASALGDVPVQTSPIVSGDVFIVVGTADGQVCARAQDDTVPNDEAEEKNPWINGCVDLDGPDDDENLPTLSSPIIGPNGRIYVTTAKGLYVIE